MSTRFPPVQRRPAAAWRFLALLVMSWMLLTPARAGPVTLVAYSGSGNAVLFDATTGNGGWVGSIDEVPDPTIASPMSLVSVVLFSYDATTGMLNGNFEFTDSMDLGSVLFGTVTGRTLDADPFGLGGQFDLDYSITSGSGRFAGFSGFGLAFLDLDPSATPDNYLESGLLVLQVPAPGTLALAGVALLLLQLGGRRRQGPGVAG